MLHKHIFVIKYLTIISFVPNTPWCMVFDVEVKNNYVMQTYMHECNQQLSRKNQ